MTKTIVIASVEMTGMEKTGKMVQRDYNWFPEFRTAPEVKALVWLHNGSTEDVTKASAYAASTDDAANTESPTIARRSFVVTFDPSEKDPLGLAKKAALDLYTKKAA
jgi:hypothetical protein